MVMPADPHGFGTFYDPAGWPDALDPHLDWPSPFDTWELMRCCLGRTLLSTNGRSTDQGGARLHPDLAAAMPEISADGLRWTFRLRKGLRYAPPLADVEITAPDLIRSFHRFMSLQLVEPYATSLYTDIVGAADYREGRASSVSGFESPDPHTLIIRLTKPAGDLAARLATAMMIPIPPSPRDPTARFGVADGHDRGYGSFLVSSGPYMLEGSGELDFSRPPAEQQPVAGMVPGQRISLVRNPSWDPATDPLRPARPDRIELYVAPTLDDAVADIYAGRADLLVNSGADPPIPADVAEAVRQDPGRGRIFINEPGTSLGITMNVALPPFDDIHVRKAVNHAINKAAMVELLGGPHRMRVGHHIVPDSMEDNLLIDYHPYGSATGAGNLDAARAEMAQSTYDTNHDGTCDAIVCQAINALADDSPSIHAVGELLRTDLAAIGLELDLQYGGMFDAFGDPSLQGAMFVPLGWGRDYLSASNFFVGQFYSPVALRENGNASLVGAAPEKLEEWGYGVTEVPNVDSRVDACVPLTGAAQFECWAALDQYLMENVVASAPIGVGVTVVLASSRVVGYAWDELSTAPSYDQIELDTGLPEPPSPSPAPPSPSGTTATDPELEGLWQTQPVTREQMALTLAAAGLDPERVDLIAENGGFRDYMVYQVEIVDGRWTQLEFPDGQPAGVFGWGGTYEVVEKGTVTATERGGGCVLTYNYEVSGDELRIDLVDDPCDPIEHIDEIFQTVIFESSPFTRVP